uniref:Di19 zinc-binding domain-containing protein n=1 Tax=Kalanchoe fedtschenkoi TaxID=63787 RepID=A0A7N0TMA7_KALFE
MDNHPWQHLMSTQLPQSRSDVIISNDYGEEAHWDEEGDEIYAGFPCPYCNDDFDLVELCCHIQDAHFAHPKNGVCPVCAVVVTTNMIAHLTKQHGKMIKISFFF